MAITHIQQLHLELIKCVDFNSFDGEVVVDGLLAHTNLWTAVIAAHSHQAHPVFRLFEEFFEDEWSPDTLWILAVNDDAATQLAKLCVQWGAEDIGTNDYSQIPELAKLTLDGSEVLLRAWWD